MIVFFGVVLSIFAIAAICFQVWANYRCNKDLVTPWTLYLLVAVIDVYAPGILFLTYEIPEQASYVSPFSQENMVVALTWFTISIPIWAIGYFGAQLKWENKIKPDITQWDINIRRVYLLAILSGGWYATYLLVDIANSGSVLEYLSFKMQRNYGSRIEYVNAAEAILFQLAPAMLTIFSMLIGILFFFREKYGRPYLWGMILPVVGWLFVATTFFRGSQIIYFLALFMLEWQRKRDSVNPEIQILPIEDKTGGGSKVNGTVVLLLIGGLLFVSYGTIRNYYNSSSESQNNPLSIESSFLLEATRLIRGEGLVGLTRIINAYPESVAYLEGKTYFDMMLLIIPRSIYTSKPDWYGVSDITRGMGGPDTTQDAVTVPGEAYANFGPFGITLTMAFGAFYGFACKYRNHSRYRFAYAFIIIPSIFSLFWMSFTGLVNSMIVLPFAIGVLHVVIQKMNKATNLECKK